MSADIVRTEQSAAVPKMSEITAGYQSALQVVDDIVLKNYIADLESMQIVPLKKSVIENNLRDNVLFFKITEMVYEKDEFSPYKFASVFNALAISDSSVFVIIDSDGMRTDFYMGIRSMDEYRTTSSLRNTVENALKGQFPGTKTQDCTIEEMEQVLANVGSKSVSAVSCVANNRVHEAVNNQNFVQGLEKLVLAMQGEKYTGIILANGTTPAQLNAIRHGYEQIYTQLSPFASTQTNYATNLSSNFSTSQTQGYSESDTHTTSNSETRGQTTTVGKSKADATGKVAAGLSAAASTVGMAFAPLTAGASMVVGGVLAGAVGGIGRIISGTKTESTSQNQSETHSASDGHTYSENNSSSQTQGESRGNSEAITFTMHDKTIENILGRIDKQLKRLDEFESLGMYECAAYFLSDDQYAAEVAASTYKALMRGENSGVETAAVNSWGQIRPADTKMICEYVKNFIHPVFQYHSAHTDIQVTPCSLVSGSELAIHMGLPRRSVCGLPVMEHADFGKEVVTYDERNTAGSIHLGNVFNMGGESANRVALDLNSLSMHTFVTGSTGSGKSNTVYEMLRQIENHGLSYMVIEPAKGEYKNVFGQAPDVYVFGSNPSVTPLLKINPFEFPEGVHILEHVDRLIEIFNVCWPMYAAMPAVLKEGVLQAYRVCGWDLDRSKNKYGCRLYPTFQDLMDQLTVVIQQSAYADEVKSNYMGSLVTRIKSLTNGLNGQIFCADEIDNQILFDRKVIVDISRIGSAETKSLIMGVLIMRLNEYRMSTSTEMNTPLKHITVLEEAHNILRRTTGAQNEEGSNVAGKSVEMLSNAIAEMRTYGEGFVIADQSPMMVDMSAIRNTNTKIIMRLPDEQDRRLVGKAAGVKDNQLDEIAKLPKGVAVVYQNDWVEPVLCKVQKFNGNIRLYHCEEIPKTSNRQCNTDILCNLLLKANDEMLDLNLKELRELVLKSSLQSRTKIDIMHALQKNHIDSIDEISSPVYDLVGAAELEQDAENAETIEDWENIFLQSERVRMSEMTQSMQNTVMECVLREQIKRFDKPKNYLDIWQEYLKGKVM